MYALARRLKSAGYQVHNWGYPSFRGTINLHAANFRKYLNGLQGSSSIHIVAHSMGSIVTRVALHQEDCANLRGIVMLCPPNHGSHAARWVAPVLGRLSTTLSEIDDRKGSFVNTLPRTIGKKHALGVIAAGSDWVVQRSSTRLPHMLDHMVLPGTHSGILLSRRAAEQTVCFLRNECFRRQS